MRDPPSTRIPPFEFHEFRPYGGTDIMRFESVSGTTTFASMEDVAEDKSRSETDNSCDVNTSFLV